MTDSRVFSNVGSSGVEVTGAGFLFLNNSFIHNDTIENPGAKISYALPAPPGTYLPNEYNCQQLSCSEPPCIPAATRTLVFPPAFD